MGEFVAAPQEPEQTEWMLCRFRRLMSEVRGGVTRRNNFEPWELEILLDLLKYRLTQARWARVFERYQKAVERQLEGGYGPPVTLSQYLVLQSMRRRSDRSKTLRSKSPGGP